jgi:hypothetical protein
MREDQSGSVLEEKICLDRPDFAQMLKPITAVCAVAWRVFTRSKPSHPGTNSLLPHLVFDAAPVARHN